jgi:asparagine synthase (glutamine-hydrolysing)
MCGICGKLYFDNQRPVERQDLSQMMEVIHHRGPDDEGTYLSGPVGLGHKRLSIIDLSTGKQPICNENGTIWIVFNGEIYNYQELRAELAQRGHAFSSQTDTEVIVHLYEEYGADCVSKLRGMFAFAIWDENNKLLFLARDRVGIKPLYYWIGPDRFLFGSEIKAILQDPSVPREIDCRIIDRFLSYYYTPGAETLLKGLLKLPPGFYLVWKDGDCRVSQYWDLHFSKGHQNYAFKNAKADLLDLLKETVRLHMISDVPVGFLLSGGVDSTSLLSLSLGETDKPLSTFTIGFEGEKFADERPYARLAADRYGTRHYDLTIKAEDFAEFLPKYVWFMEEPVCEPPAIAIYYVSKLASEYVKVLISGEGGDEAFAGYQNYRNLVWLERMKKTMGPFAKGLGQVMGKVDKVVPFGRLSKYIPLLSRPLAGYYFSRTSNPFTILNKEFSEIYTHSMGEQIDREFSLRPSVDSISNGDCPDYLARMLYVDTKTWLPDDLLVKADKMTMANSVELRVPLLDHKVLEFAAGLPSSFKLNGFTTKYILKETFKNLVPEEIINRPKTGLPVPYGSWMRKQLRRMVQETLLDQRSIARGYFNREGIEKILSANLNEGSYDKEVFSLLVLELWHCEFIDKIPGLRN